MNSILTWLTWQPFFIFKVIFLNETKVMCTCTEVSYPESCFWQNEIVGVTEREKGEESGVVGATEREKGRPTERAKGMGKL